MSSENLRTIVERAFDEAFKGNVEALDEVVAPDIVFHRPPHPDVKGLTAYKQGVADMRKPWSDMHMAFDDFFVEGNKCATRWTLEATHTGVIPELPVPPTGKRITMTGISLVHMVNGKSAEEWEYVDMLGLMQQLGAAPPK
jgi:predicted ester cyclase